MKKIATLILLLFSTCGEKDKMYHRWLHLKNGGKVKIGMLGQYANGRAIAFDKAGNIVGIDYHNDNTKTGNAYLFYANGNVQKIITYTEGHETGPQYNFYRDGALSNIRHCIDGKTSGQLLQFYQRPRNRLESRVSYSIVRGKEWQNGYITYDTAGAVTERRQWLRLAFDQPVYRLQDSVGMTVTVLGPRQKLVKAQVGPFDAVFSGYGTVAERTFYGRNHMVQVKVKPERKGLNYVRGYVSDYRVIPTKTSGALYDTEERQLFFEARYRVE